MNLRPRKTHVHDPAVALTGESTGGGACRLPEAQQDRLLPDSPRSGEDGRAPGRRTTGRSRTPDLPRYQPTRGVVRQVACPSCGANAGEPCHGRRGPRAAHHAARVLRAAPGS